MQNKTKRKVMAIKADYVKKQIGEFTGFCPKDILTQKNEEFYKTWNRLFERECQFINKEEAETDPDWKQVIPYFLLINKDEVMTYSRGTETETRLHGSRSIGVGGHIEPFDGVLPSEAYFTGAQRELIEEINMKIEFEEVNNSFIGIINDESSEVSKVHIGIAHLVIINDEERTQIEGADLQLGQIEFVKIDELEGKIAQYESWSRHAIKMITRHEDLQPEMAAFLSEAIRLCTRLIYPASTRMISTSMPMNHVLEMEISKEIKELSKLISQAQEEEVL